MCFIFITPTPLLPARRIRVLLFILFPPFLPHPGLHQYTKSSPTLVHSLEQNSTTLLSFLGPWRRRSPGPSTHYFPYVRDPEMRDFCGKPNFLSPPQVQPLATPLSMLFASCGKIQLGPLPGSPPCQPRSLTSRTPRRQLETCRSRAHRGPTTNPFSPSQAQNPPRFEQASSGGTLLQ